MQFFNQLLHGFNALAPSKRIAVILSVILSLVLIGLMVVLMNQKEYRVLFSNLPEDDAGKIIARLQEKHIVYKLSPAGNSILVPAGKVSELRLDMASSGLPQGGVIGFEIFDKKSYGVTDFVQQLNYQRALQGELARTINSLDRVQSSRVHIVMPKKSLFVGKEAKPTASVFLKLKGGGGLAQSQVDGIVHLVSGSVEELQPENVMVVDSKGRVFSKTQSGSKIARRTTSQTEYQSNVEQELSIRIQSMLKTVVGEGKVIAKVSAAIDFRVMEKTEEIYDSEEPAVRSRHRRTELSGQPVSGGGQSTVAPASRTTGVSLGAKNERTDEVVNYEINRTISKTVMPVGSIKKLSVAVLVDGVYSKNDKGVEEYQPRSKKEMVTMEDIVRKSIGFDAGRGDQVVISSVPFKKIEAEQIVLPEKSWKSKLGMFVPILKYVVSSAVIIFIIIFVLRPMLKSILQRGEERMVMTGGTLSPASGQIGTGTAELSLLGGGQQPGVEAEVPEEVQAIKRFANVDDEGFTDVIKDWLK